MRSPNLVSLSSYTDSSRICFLDQAIDKATALHQLATVTATHPGVSQPEAFVKAIFERERVSSTGIGRGIAVPHAKLPSINDFIITVGISRDGLEFAAKDGEPVHVLVMIAANNEHRDVYLKVLATVAGKLRNETVYNQIRYADDASSALTGLLQD